MYRVVYKLYVGNLVRGNPRTTRYIRMLWGSITSGCIEQYADCHVPNFQHTACKRSWGCTIAVRNMSSHQLLWIKSIITHCVSCWTTNIFPIWVTFTLYKPVTRGNKLWHSWQMHFLSFSFQQYQKSAVPCPYLIKVLEHEVIHTAH